MLDFLTIYNSLGFLTESIRLQYTNFIFKHQEKLDTLMEFDDVINRLRRDEPIEYVFNLAEFSGLEFYVDKRCLIPRIETEEIVHHVIEIVSKNSHINYTIVDVGTGSGCIILSIAAKLKILNLKTQFIGIDISDDALDVARINREKLGLTTKVKLGHISFQNFHFQNYRNLIICSNLPYIPLGEDLQKSVINYEPHLALFGGEKGSELNEALLVKIRDLKNVRAVLMEGKNGQISINN
jgi:release factor glutamine methyltransferase